MKPSKFQPTHRENSDAITHLVQVESAAYDRSAHKPAKFDVSVRTKELLTAFDDPAQLLIYGSDVMKDIAASSDLLLNEVQDENVDFVESQLTKIMVLANSVKMPQAPTDGLSKLLHKLKSNFVNVKEQLLMEFSNVSEQMDRIVDEIDYANVKILHKLEGLKVQYNKNLEEYKRLDLLISAAEEVYKMKSIELEKTTVNDMIGAETANRMSRSLDRLDKKINDLKRYQMMALQTAPTIAQMEDSALILLQKFNDIKLMTIPMWKRQVRMFIDGQELERGAQLASSIDDANNNLIKSGSSLISKTSIATAKLSQRSVVDMDTIEEVHNNLVNTIAEVKNISQEGRQKRRESEQRMEEMKRFMQVARSTN